MTRICAKCGIAETLEHPLHEHHVIPKAGWMGTDKDGRILLCEKHHNILANLLLSHVGKNLMGTPLWDEMRMKIKSFTGWWIG